ncbi:MAG: thioredoxin family protein [Thermoplasmata archaeon]
MGFRRSERGGGAHPGPRARKPARARRTGPRPPVSSYLLRRALHSVSSITEPVGLFFFGSTKCPSASLEGVKLWQELASANPMIMLRVYDETSDAAKCKELGVSLFPATLIAGRNRGTMRFYGVPSGYSFQALAEAIDAASSGLPGLSPAAQERLGAIKRPLRLRVFVNSVSPLCARLSSLALRLAVGSDFVHTEVFSITDFPEIAEMYRVDSTPRTVVNGRTEIRGAPPEAEFVEELLGAQVPRTDGYA